jgi:hypothetical protein
MPMVVAFLSESRKSQGTKIVSDFLQVSPNVIISIRFALKIERFHFTRDNSFCENCSCLWFIWSQTMNCFIIKNLLT